MEKKDNPRSFQKFKKIPLIFSTIFLLCSLSIYLFLYTQISNNMKTEQDAEIKWQNETSRRNEMSTLNQSIKTIDQERIALNSHFISSANVVPFLDDIGQLSQEANISSDIVSVDILQNKGGLQVGVKSSGTFANFYKFLTLMENSPYEVEFTSVDMQGLTDISGTGKKTANPMWNAAFKVKLLSFIQ